MVQEHIIREDLPDTSQIEYDLLDEGKVFEAYSLRYLRQIRDLLLNLKEGTGNSLEFLHNIKHPDEAYTQSNENNESKKEGQ